MNPWEDSILIERGWVAARTAIVRYDEGVVAFSDFCLHVHVTQDEARACGGAERPHVFYLAATPSGTTRRIRRASEPQT